MSVEQFIAILGALGVLIGAVASAIVQLRQTHALVNSRMTELLELTQRSALAEGKLESASQGRGQTYQPETLPSAGTEPPPLA